VDKDYRPVKDMEGFVTEIRNQDLLIREVEKDIKENGFTPYRWYLLFRNNYFITDLANKLEYRVIPYHTPGGFFINDRELAKIRRFYSYRKKGFGTEESFKIFCTKYNIKDINEEFVESNLISTERRYVYFDYIRRYGIDALEEMARKEPSILLATTHRVKGGEADHVAVFLDCTRQVDMNRQFGTDEELRVLYVACTRARIGLYLVASNSKYSLERLVDIAKEHILPEEGTAC
jgi:superfamily I DNA/RNA helicase